MCCLTNFENVPLSLFNFIPTHRSEVLYSNKKLSSSTFQRFHCLTLDITNDTSSSSSSSSSGRNSSSSSSVMSNRSTLNSNHLNFPPLGKNTENKSVLKSYSESYQGPGSIERKTKMTLDLALQKYFQLEVYEDSYWIDFKVLLQYRYWSIS